MEGRCLSGAWQLQRSTSWFPSQHHNWSDAVLSTQNAVVFASYPEIPHLDQLWFELVCLYHYPPPWENLWPLVYEAGLWLCSEAPLVFEKHWAFLLEDHSDLRKFQLRSCVAELVFWWISVQIDLVPALGCSPVLYRLPVEKVTNVHQYKHMKKNNLTKMSAAMKKLLPCSHIAVQACWDYHRLTLPAPAAGHFSVCPPGPGNPVVSTPWHRVPHRLKMQHIHLFSSWTYRPGHLHWREHPPGPGKPADHSPPAT